MSGRIRIACAGVVASLAFALPATQANIVGFDGGVGSGTNQYTQNSNDGVGAAYIFGPSPAYLDILRGNPYVITSVFYNTAQNIVGNFQASYTAALISPDANSGDGFTFIIQNDVRGVTALQNADADGLGEGGISPSFVIGVNNFSKLLDVEVNGVNLSPPTDLSSSGLNFNDPVTYNVFYTPATNIATFTATQGSTVFTDPINLGTQDLETLIGSPTAYVGFTGESFGQQQDGTFITQTERITNFSYTATAVPEPTAGLLVGAPAILGLLRRRSRSSMPATV